MLENILGRFISGALWGLAAGVVATVASGRNPGTRAFARRIVALGIAASERAQALGGGAREGLEDLYTEARAEHAHPDDHHAPAAPRSTPRARARRTRTRRG
jgi:hypothetical protein